MNKGRWQHLDLRKPDAPPPPATPQPPVESPAEAPASVPDPTVRQAGTLYLLRQYEQCADLLTAALAVRPEAPGAERLLGLALGMQGDFKGAVHHLRAALEQSPGDSQLLASLLTAELKAGRASAAPGGSLSGPAAEVAGATAWRWGQQLLDESRWREAALAFHEAAELFRRASPPKALPERASAAYLGETISHLAAGELEAAQQGFARIGDRRQLPEAASRFARGLYELGEELRQVPRDEWELVTSPLVALLLGARLRIAFYDGQRPVDMFWENLPAG